jgi:hypothetical protein
MSPLRILMDERQRRPDEQTVAAVAEVRRDA